MSRTGVAAIMREYSSPLELAEYPVPQAEPGALVVEVDVATMCGSDVHAWEGAYEGVQPVERPLILGHEAVGRVARIGSGADRDSLGQSLVTGDRVVWTHGSCGRCWACSMLAEPTLCTDRKIGMLTTSARAPHFCGTFAQYSYVWPTSGRVRVPDDVPSTWASAASCALRTAVKAVERAGGINPLDAVVVQGAGPVGLFLTAVLSTRGPRELIVVGAPSARLALAERWGATHTASIDDLPDPAAREQRVRDLTDGRGADLVFEAAGVGSTVAEGIELLAHGGRYVVVGAVTGQPQAILAHRIVNRGLRVVGSYGGHTDAYYTALEFMRRHAGTFAWDDILGNGYRLDQVTDGLRNLKHATDMKPVIHPVA